MINNSYLLGLYGVSGGTMGPLTSGSASGPRKTQPTPPWYAEKPVEASSLVRAALSGRRIINEAAAEIDLAGASPDYRKMFSLYQGLNTLSALTNRAMDRGVSASEQALIQRRFAAGLDEAINWLGKTQLEDLRLVQGVASSTLKSTAGIGRDSARSVMAPVHEGAIEAEVAAFQGTVQFSITATTQTGSTTVDIDLSEMGATSRTLDAVITHINGKLEAAGVVSRMERQFIPAEPRTLKVGDKTVTLPSGQDRWALAVAADSLETISFAAPQTADAVYVVQAADAGDRAGHQLLKFQTDLGGTPPAAEARVGETRWVDGRASQSAMPDGVETVRASATGPDGSLWVLADVSTGPDGQPIKGKGDVALLKYDSAGRLMFTRTLGAADQASGFALSVNAEGKVAVAGSVTGGLDPTRTPASLTEADSFVTVFDAAGQELWTQSRGAKAADEATSVVWGADGSVYVAGRSRSALPGEVALGGWDSYVQGFSQTEAWPGAPLTVTPTFASQFGGAGDDAVSAMAIEGNTLVTVGLESGRAVVRSYTLNGTGAPTLNGTRDLGVLSGEIAGVAIEGGRVVVAGSSSNAALDAGTVNTAHNGGRDAFVAALDISLAPSAGDRLTWLGAAGEDSVADMKMHGGKVWISGVADRPAGADEDVETRGYLSRVDPLTGAVEWTRTWTGDGNQASPAAIAVASGGASVLDRLGLPQGAIPHADSKRLIDGTSLRAGDRFYIASGEGGRPVEVRIDAKDTLQTLASRIESASRNRLKVTLTNKDGLQVLSIAARPGRSAIITAGEVGRDALAGLGLTPGYISPASEDDDSRKTYGLDLSRKLSLADDAGRKAADEMIQKAMQVLRSAYRDMGKADEKPRITGEVPAYLKSQLANYQAALDRLLA